MLTSKSVLLDNSNSGNINTDQSCEPSNKRSRKNSSGIGISSAGVGEDGEEYVNLDHGYDCPNTSSSSSGGTFAADNNVVLVGSTDSSDPNSNY